MEDYSLAPVVAYGLYGAIAVALFFVAIRMIFRRARTTGMANVDAMLSADTMPQKIFCLCCKKQPIHAAPIAQARWIDSAMNPHAQRLYGDPPVAHLVEGPGSPVLCGDHYGAAYRLLEAFHARQRSRVMALTAELAREAASYEGGGVIQEVKGMGVVS